jgi:cell division topological specificity factor
MNPFRFLTPIRSAPIARERLHVLVHRDRTLVKQTDLVAILREEVFSLIGRHVTFDASKVRVKQLHGAAVCSVVVDIESPNWAGAMAMAAISPACGRPVAGPPLERQARPCA